SPEVLGRVLRYFAEASEPCEGRASAAGNSPAESAHALTLLSGRYDVVTTNPPYLGPKFMGPVLRQHLDERHPDTREHLLAAFLQRCFALPRPGGVTAAVSTKSWLHQASFRKFRRAVLDTYTLGAFADLGSDAFHADLGLHHGVSVILTCFRKQPPDA